LDGATRSLFSSAVRTLIIILIIVIAITGGLFLFVRSEHVSLFQVSGDSMLPQYHDGEYVLVKKASQLKVGQTIFFHPPASFFDGLKVKYGSGATFIKKIAALPGQTLSYNGSSFMVNGRVIYSDGIHHYSCPHGLAGYSHTLGRQVFVLGDNATVSLDSRRVFCDGAVEGFLVPLKNIIENGSVILHS
jgi:signal peptidase I